MQTNTLAAPSASDSDTSVNQLVTGVAPQMSGEFGVEDIEIPRVSLTQRVSDLADQFTPGEFVLDRVIGLGTEFNFVVLSLKKTYVEDLDYGTDERPQVFETLKDAQDAGFTTAWDSGSPRVVSVLDALLLIEGDKGDPSGRFTDVHKGKGYVRALYSVRNSAYRLFGKPLITAGTAGHLKTDLAGGQWTATSSEQSNGKNKWFAPTTKPAGLVDTKFRQFITDQYDL